MCPPGAALSPYTFDSLKQEEGGIVFRGSDGSLLGGFGAPWAKDVSGKDIGTHYELADGAVIQVVDIVAPDRYPIVADPYLWIDLISSATWTHNSNGWTLEVKPMTWARLQVSCDPR
ncbi:MAG: hypothetical protein LBJ08_10445 [Bifidobacteriaceae bacterium]|jgi:hypothetical protein|nr:hypothetical protein [Bifidobacteriaceae bacterium]